MNRDEYARLFQLEDHHWWFVGMRRIAETLLEPHLRAPMRILDAGCGTGGCFSWLTPYGKVWGIDWSPEALAYCQKRGLSQLCRGSVLALPYRDASFDLATNFDVLYHRSVTDDRQALGELRRVVRTSGLGLVRVPALPILWSSHDEAVHARQRYLLDELCSKATCAGWEVVRGTYANSLLLPIAAAQRWLKAFAGHHGPSEVQETPNLLNALNTKILWLESQWLRWSNLPLGLSALALLRAR